ncbi:hypothetical protein HMPREF1154_0904 [Capnocytophaga sp. CM59]|nr:hypothetical protein HMPREF1154_0904 [Capnocytophaga sp. CM59]
MPKGIGAKSKEFYNIENLEEKGAMTLRGNVLKDCFDKDDFIFLISDSITKEKFEFFLKEIKGENDQVYVVYHLNNHDDRKKFDESIPEGIEGQYKKVGQHIENGLYDIFLQNIKTFLEELELPINGGNWVSNDTLYTQPQVQEIISAIFKDEADDKLNKNISILMEEFKKICETEDKDERMKAFEALAKKRDELLNALINNQK